MIKPKLVAKVGGKGVHLSLEAHSLIFTLGGKAMTKKRLSRHKNGIKTNVEGEDQKKSLKIVVKCNSVGSLGAVVSSLKAIQNLVVEVKIIHSGIGAVNKSDLLTAMTGSRFVLGFNVDLLPKIQTLGKEKGG
jgi:translation initiation factor IF-2